LSWTTAWAGYSAISAGPTSLRDNKAICRPEHVATLNKLRVQYSREIVGHAALKLGWQKVVKSDNKLLLRKGC